MSTIIIAAILIAVTIAIPLVFISIGRMNTRKRNQENLRLFNLAASNNNLSFFKQEVFKDKIIGLDGANTVLLIYTLKNSNVIRVNLKEVSTCTVNKEYESVDIGSDKKARIEKHLRSIDLTFKFKGNVEPVSISFYDSSVNSIYEMAELESKAKGWETVLSKMVPVELRAIA